MKKVLVVGSINMDLVFNVDKLPVKGQTIFAKNFEKHHGGKGANQTVAISKLSSTPIKMMGVVGNDEYGIEILESMKKLNVNISDIKKINSAFTGTASITVDKNGSNTIVVVPGANHIYDNDFVNKIFKEIDDYDILVLQLEIPYEVVKELINYAKTRNKIIVLNPAPARNLDDDIYKNVSYLIVNETELETLSGAQIKSKTIDDIKTVAKDFKVKKQINNLIVTIGTKGSFIIDFDNNYQFVGANKVKAVDTTAAGDSYLGAFVYQLANLKPTKEALEFASKVAAITVSKKGAQESIPTLMEVKSFKF